LIAINCDDPTNLLVESCSDPDIMFDVVYINGNKNTIKDTVFDGTACISMLKNDGIIIFDNYDHPIVKAGVDIIENASDTISLYKGDIAVYTL
jgi:predicted O-methyltransferase YrrM